MKRARSVRSKQVRSKRGKRKRITRPSTKKKSRKKKKVEDLNDAPKREQKKSKKSDKAKSVTLFKATATILSKNKFKKNTLDGNPIRGARKTLQRAVRLINENEFNTSQACPHCLNRMISATRPNDDGKMDEIHGIKHCQTCVKTYCRDTAAAMNLMNVLKYELNLGVPARVDEQKFIKTFSVFHN